MMQVRIAGVPEHFNLPWQMAIEEGAFREHGIALHWLDVPEGTGRMCELLQKGKADLAVILTEGIIKSIASGNPSKIIQEYIASPLLWGIYVDYHSPYRNISELEGAKAAISRFGSGSHLMAYVMAQDRGWDTNDLKFEVVNTLDNAVEALQTGWADFFLWEHFTTKPLVDQQVFRRLGDCPSPWPCFVIAARQEFITNQADALSRILDIINQYTREFKDIPSIDRTLANRYHQQLEDIRSWLSVTYWSQDAPKSEVIDNVIDTLYELNLLSNKIKTQDILTI